VRAPLDPGGEPIGLFALPRFPQIGALGLSILDALAAIFDWIACAFA